MENRVEILRNHIDELIKDKASGKYRNIDKHMHAVSQFAAMLAIKRGLSPEIAIMTGLLHDIHTLLSDEPEDHANLGAVKAKEILTELKIVSGEEMSIICNAVKNHSAKGTAHSGYSQVLKDADVFSHYFYNPSLDLEFVDNGKKGSKYEIEKMILAKLFDELELNRDAFLPVDRFRSIVKERGI